MSKLIHWIAGGTLNATQYEELKDQLVGIKEEDDAETSIVDELRLDPLIDLYTDQMFGWLTVLINEPKYYFFAPAIVESITKRLRSQGASKNSKKWRHEVARRELRYLEACLCEALCILPKPRSRIIGINRWTKSWKNRNTFVTRASVISNKGIQEQIGMHIVPRYLHRSQVLFTADKKRSAALELLDEAISSEKEPVFWWHHHPKLRSVVSKHADIFNDWLLRESKVRQMSIDLNLEEKGLLMEGLFGKGKKTFSQEFLSLSSPVILKEFEENPKQRPSILLTKLAKALPPQFAKKATTAALIAEAVGIIRYCYSAKISDSYSIPEVKIKIKRLSNITLSREIPEKGSFLAQSSLEFLNLCIKAAKQKGHLEVLKLIYQREEEVKGTRRKLYLHKDGTIRVQPHLIENADELRYQEPMMRTRNVQHVLWRAHKRVRK